jgi:hypothetical protein
MRLTAILAKAVSRAFFSLPLHTFPADTPSVTVKVTFSILHAFCEDLSKPISKQCATSCKRRTSPLVIWQTTGQPSRPLLLHADKIPASLVAADKVIVTGKVYQRRLEGHCHR